MGEGMLKKSTARLAALGLCVAALGGCVQTVKSERSAELAEREAPITKIAVLPFHVGASLAEREVAPGDTSATVAATLLSHHLTEALSTRIAVVAPQDVQLAIDAAGVEPTPRTLGAMLKEQFGADAMLFGELARWREREGGPAGATHGATVGFTVVLFDERGQRLWSAQVDETQHALSENVLSASRYPGGGSRWLTAEELARWAAGETAASVPLAP
jgi:hypothetical protein